MLLLKSVLGMPVPCKCWAGVQRKGCSERQVVSPGASAVVGLSWVLFIVYISYQKWKDGLVF